MHVIDQELQHRWHRYGQGEGGAVAQLEPGRPVTQGARVTALGVRRFPLLQQGPHGVRRLGMQNLRVAREHRRMQYEPVRVAIGGC